MPPRAQFLTPSLSSCFLRAVPRHSHSLRPSVSVDRKVDLLNSRRQYASRPRRPQYNKFQQNVNLWNSSGQYRVVVSLLGGGFVVWIVSNIEKVPVSGRYRFNCVSEKYEAEVGRQAYVQTINEYRGAFLDPRDPRHKLVGKVLERLLPNSGLKGDWEFHVIQDDTQTNAFVLPGGKVFVFSGILPICQTEAGLATVLGHEIAHNMAHHMQERLSIPAILQAIGWIGILVGFDPSLPRLALYFGLELPNSRGQESEADQLGLTMMAKSCYDPEEAVQFWQRMVAAEKGAVPQFISTHPASKNRIQQIQSWLPQAVQQQTQSDCGNTVIQQKQFQGMYGSYAGQNIRKPHDDPDFW